MPRSVHLPEKLPITVFARLFCFIQYLLPHHLLSRGVYALTRLAVPGLTTWVIRQFIRSFKVDMQIAVEPDAAAYPTFNRFFTRAIQPDARPIAQDNKAIACPVDGTVSQAGIIHDDQIFQAKGHNYSLQALLGGDHNGALINHFRNGTFATLYLSPRDYHRIHMPITGTLQSMTHIPGRLFSVNDAAARYIPGLFARNERLVTIFDTEAGPMALVLVGALFVSSIETVWAGDLPRRVRGQPQHWQYGEDKTPAPTLAQGAEMGRFNMGSTVIVLFGADATSLADSLTPGASVKMGQLMATQQD